MKEKGEEEGAVLASSNSRSFKDGIFEKALDRTPELDYLFGSDCWEVLGG
jgi:hypothetical protein